MASDAPASPAIQPYPQRWLILAAIVLTTFLGTWDGSAPVVALPAITRQYGVGIDSAVWVLTLSSLLFAVPMAIFGKLGDMIGHKRIYLIATLIYILAAAGAGTAPTFGWLIFFRSLEGLASAPWFTAALAIFATTFAPNERGRAMGIMGAGASLAWASGPLLGGLLLQAFDWQAIILVEIPVAILSLAMAWWLIPEDSHKTQEQFDLAGAATFTGLALVLMFGLRIVSDSGWASLPTLAAGGAFVVILALFILIERRHVAPFIPLNLFANRRYTVATLFSATQIVTQFAMMFLVPLYLLEVAGLDPAASGLIVAGLSVARIIFEPVAGRIAELRGCRLPSTVGIGMIIAVAAGFAFVLAPTTPGGIIFTALFVFGVGIVLGRTPVFLAVTHLADRERLGLALGVFSMLTFAGGALGQTFFGVLLQTLSGSGSAPLATVPEPELVLAFSICFALVVGLAALAGVFAQDLPGRKMMNDVVAIHS
ncbi:MAG TPA: MFS transporter [Anaerolineae bacterium]|nr:MFS transporter [Anaerolineae bacterium]